MARRVMWLVRALALALALALPVAAQTLPDPTRPANATASAEGVDAVPAGPTLQAIRTLNGVRTAVISGQVLKAGDKFADQRVLRIDEDQVVLRGSAGTATLKLFPGVVKTAPATEPDKTRRRGDHAQRKEAR